MHPFQDGWILAFARRPDCQPSDDYQMMCPNDMFVTQVGPPLRPLLLPSMPAGFWSRGASCQLLAAISAKRTTAVAPDAASCRRRQCGGHVVHVLTSGGGCRMHAECL